MLRAHNGCIALATPSGLITLHIHKPLFSCFLFFRFFFGKHFLEWEGYRGKKSKINSTNLNHNIMAHNLNFNEQTAKHSFFSVKEKVWHNLGQIIQGYPTSAEAIH